MYSKTIQKYKTFGKYYREITARITYDRSDVDGCCNEFCEIAETEYPNGNSREDEECQAYLTARFDEEFIDMQYPLMFALNTVAKETDAYYEFVRDPAFAADRDSNLQQLKLGYEFLQQFGPTDGIYTMSQKKEILRDYKTGKVPLY